MYTLSPMKRTIFNLIILDESGSMSPVTGETIMGCNETLSAVRAMEKKNGASERNLVSIYAFQSGAVPSRYIVKNKPIDSVKDITSEDYSPSGCTPMLDAIGMTLVDLRAVASTHEDSIGIVTIITDGYENSSREYTWSNVRDIIRQLKDLGWTINFIGANIDVDKVADNLEIDNRMKFDNDSEGTKSMFSRFASFSAIAAERRIIEEACQMSDEERIEKRKIRGRSFFNR